jgi:hypothetical protein
MEGWWRIVVPAGALELDLPRQTWEKRVVAGRVRCLAADSVVALRGDVLGSSWRSRSFLQRTGLRLEREYVAFPGFDGPGFLIEASHSSFRHFFRQQIAMPSGGSFKVMVVGVLSHLASTGALWRLAASLARARLVIARRV